MFATGRESESAVYNAWKALKLASLPASEREAVKDTLSAHTPKNIEPKKRRATNKMLKGVNKYLPTSDEHIAVLEERNAKASQANKKTKTAKAAKSAEQEKNTTIKMKNRTSK